LSSESDVNGKIEVAGTTV